MFNGDKVLNPSSSVPSLMLIFHTEENPTPPKPPPRAREDPKCQRRGRSLFANRRRCMVYEEGRAKGGEVKQDFFFARGNKEDAP